MRVGLVCLDSCCCCCCCVRLADGVSLTRWAAHTSKSHGHLPVGCIRHTRQPCLLSRETALHARKHRPDRWMDEWMNGTKPEKDSQQQPESQARRREGTVVSAWAHCRRTFDDALGEAGRGDGDGRRKRSGQRASEPAPFLLKSLVEYS